MSGHDPAPLVVPPLQRKERRPEKREEDLRRAERERERKRPLVSHSTRSKTRYKTRCNAASAAIKSESRMSIVPAHLALREREREREIAAINRKCVTSSIALSFSLFIFLSLSLSLSRQRTPRRSVNQVENPQESVLNSRWSLSIRRGVVLSDLLPNKNVITAYAIAIYVENCCRAIDQSAWNYKSLILDSNKWISTMIEVLFDDDECKEIYFLHYLTALRFNHFDWKVLIEIVTII